MTVTATSYTPLTYNGNGSTSVFNITFQFYEIAVIHIDSSGSETEWVENTHYTVTGGEGSTGSVTATPTVPATGEKLRIERRTSKDQPRDYDLDNAVLEAALQQSDDRLAMILQELDYDNRRRPAISKTNYTAEVEFPTASTGNVLSWGSDGNLANTALLDLDGIAISGLSTTASLEDADLVPLYDQSAGDNAAITWANVKNNVSTFLNLGALASLDIVDTNQIEDDAVTAEKLHNAVVLDINGSVRHDEVQSIGDGGAQARANIGADVNLGELHLQYQQPSGTGGGYAGSTLNQWVDYPLNTEIKNTIAGSYSISNKFYLPVGTYKISARARGQNSGNSLLLLHAYSGGVNKVVRGDSCFAAGSNDSDLMILTDEFQVVSAGEFAIRRRVTSTTGGSNDLGRPVTVGMNEIYGNCIIRKVA